MQGNDGAILALDYGAARIGLAKASRVARIASPLEVISNDENVIENLKNVINRENVTQLVVGLPRNMSGEATDQTKLTREFIAKLKENINLPIDVQDESLTSKKAEQELKQRGRLYKKEDVDTLAATYILEDWLSEQRII